MYKCIIWIASVVLLLQLKWDVLHVCMCLCVCELWVIPWVKFISEITQLPFLFLFVNAFTRLVLKDLFFCLCKCRNYTITVQENILMVTPQWVKTFKNGLLARYYHLPFLYALKVTKIANLFNLKQCQFNVTFVSLLSPIVLFFWLVCGQVLHTNQCCPSSCAWDVKSVWHCYMEALGFCMSPVCSPQTAIIFHLNNRCCEWWCV